MPQGPLSHREAILELLQAQTRAVHAREIAARLHLEETAFPGLLHELEALAASGVLLERGRHRFRASPRGPRAAASREPERQGFLTVAPRGFGFVASPGFDDDLYIPEERLGGGMHGDLVTARLVARSSRGSEGEVLRVTKRRNDKVPGVLRVRGRSMWLEPDDVRLRGPIVLHPSRSRGGPEGEDGMAAVARITRFPELPRETPEGELEAVLGSPGDPKVEVAKILVREGIDEPHPADAVEEAEAYGKEIDPAACVGREDLTHLPLPTIDPEDARDHDDAVWAERKSDGSYRVWIAIADVSHYVRPGTALDREALARGCSIYLPDRAIPMLPRALSSHLCSLLPGTPRLCLAVEADLDPAGVVQSFRVVEGFMRSAAKLTYGGVARTLKFSNKPPKSPEAEELREGLEVLRDLSALLRAQRMRRGALDFELPEVKIVLDPQTGAPIGVEKRSEDPGVKKAYQLIEELMLLANELVARLLSERGIPTIYRVHGPPDEAKLDRFANMASALGVTFDLEDAKDPKKLSALLKRIAKHPSRDVFNMLLLRAMKQATYDTANIGHFGLASKTYLHFTSPIRRYPDMVVHRAVRALLAKKTADKSETALEILKTSATTASERERHAMDVERETVDLYRALYMRGHLGESFSARVTALVGAGVFAQIDSPFVDVLVKTEALGGDRYELDEDGMRMVGMRSGDAVALGDPMELAIEDVAILRRTVYGRRVAVATALAAAETAVAAAEEGETVRAPRAKRPSKAGTGASAGAGGRKGSAERGGTARGKKPVKAGKPRLKANTTRPRAGAATGRTAASGGAAKKGRSAAAASPARGTKKKKKVKRR